MSLLSELLFVRSIALTGVGDQVLDLEHFRLLATRAKVGLDTLLFEVASGVGCVDFLLI